MLPLRPWQRFVVGTVVIVDVLLSAALIFFQLGTRAFRETELVSPVRTMAPALALPPGTDVDYSKNQR
jgi:hypothetical protein